MMQQTGESSMLGFRVFARWCCVARRSSKYRMRAWVDAVMGSSAISLSSRMKSWNAVCDSPLSRMHARSIMSTRSDENLGTSFVSSRCGGIAGAEMLVVSG